MTTTILYIVAFIEFILAGYMKFKGLDWQWVAFCSLYVMGCAIWVNR